MAMMKFAAAAMFAGFARHCRFHVDYEPKPFATQYYPRAETK